MTAGALDPTKLYSGDNGRITCGQLRCAGSTAHATGRDLSGQRMRRVTKRDRAEFVQVVGHGPRCETCGRE